MALISSTAGWVYPSQWLLVMILRSTMPSITNILGPMLIGVIFNGMLYGVMIVQAFIYYQTYAKDASWIRLFVLYLVIIETINSGCDIGIIYQPLITNFGSPAAVTFFPIMLAATPIITVLISTPIQMFTAWRIFVISRSIWPTLIIYVFALVSMGGGVWTAACVIIFRFFEKKPALNTPGAVWFIASAIADVVITVSLIVSLYRRRTGLASTDSAINRIIRLTIQTGLITSIFALADLISFLSSPNTTFNFIWDFSLSKLYTNALLSTLNARAGWSHLNANGQNPDNVLFGTEVPSTASDSTRKMPDSLVSRQYIDMNENSTNFSTFAPAANAYEMRSFDTVKGLPDVHINITKQIDSREDYSVQKPQKLAE